MIDMWGKTKIIVDKILDNAEDYRNYISKILFTSIYPGKDNDKKILDEWVEWFKIDPDTGESKLGDWRSDFSRALGAVGSDRCVKRSEFDGIGDVLHEAEAIANGIYSMNAKFAKGYGFNVSGRKISSGEFLYSNEMCSSKYDFIYLYKNKKFYRLEEEK